MVFTLSHGQAAIERGFSVNKETIETNMLEMTIVAQRMICDGVKRELSNENSDDVSKLIINKEMMKYCSRARAKYGYYLDDNRENLKKSQAAVTKQKIKEELEKERKNKANWANSYDRYMKRADELAVKAETDKKMSLISESNASRKRAREILEQLEVVSAKILKLESQLKG